MRLVLDTNTFRGLPVPQVASVAERGFKLSVSETAIEETWARSAREFGLGKSRQDARGLLFGRARKLLPYIDEAYPVAPSGEYAITRIRQQVGEAVNAKTAAECAEHLDALKHCWRTITGVGFTDEAWLESGRNHGAFLAEVDDLLADLARREDDIWADKDETTREEFRLRREEFGALPGADKLATIRAYARETWAFSERVAERLDALVSVTAWRLHVAAGGAQMPAENDGSDNRLLIHLGEGFVLLSEDAGLVRAVDACGTFQAPWVRRLVDLGRPLPDGPPWGDESRLALHPRR